MRLNQKDKEEIISRVVEEMKKMLTVPVTLEKYIQKGGKITSVPQLKHEEWFLPAAFLQVLSNYEGSNRGMQQDIYKCKMKVNYMEAKFTEISKQIADSMRATQNILLALQQPIIKIAEEKKREIVYEKEEK